MKRGVALIEFAGSLVLLSIVFAGMFQIGYSFYVYGTLLDAVRAAARYASLQNGPPVGPNDGIIRTARNLVVYGDPAPATGAAPRLPGLATDNIKVDFGAATTTVSVRGYKLDSLFSLLKLDGRPAVTFPITQGTGK